MVGIIVIFFMRVADQGNSLDVMQPEVSDKAKCRGTRSEFQRIYEVRIVVSVV